MSVHYATLREPAHTPWLPRTDWRGLIACACFGIRYLTSLPARRRTTNGARRDDST